MVEEDIVEEASNKPKKKGTTIKTRKSVTRKIKGNYGDSDDEDFASNVKAKKTASSKKIDEDGPRARTAANKAKIAATAAIFDPSDEDSEDEKPRRKRINLNGNDSAHSDTEMKSAPKPAAVSRTVSTNTTSKRKRWAFIFISAVM